MMEKKNYSPFNFNLKLFPLKKKSKKYYLDVYNLSNFIFESHQLFMKSEENHHIKSNYFVCHKVMMGEYLTEKMNFLHKILDVDCKRNSIRCNSSRNCINSNDICDGANDCLMNEDEENCPPFKINEYFRCKTSSRKIKYSLVCNFQKDCSDNSDENFCGLYK